ncbi:hypothetical protein [Acinetobacter pittii]|uniref:hypothetical protein n=1 Tax=Acinetobacter pittii TaxID=48296 RepID=UPI00192C0C49|nr:hypothetical protein [Acinetobacter pittii]
MTFEEWYEDWTGSKVNCENTDVIAAWQHQQAKVEELQKRVDAVVCELDCQIQCSVSSHTQKMLIEIRQALKGEGQ